MREPNYMTELRRMIAAGEIRLEPGVQTLDVAHEVWCASYRGGICDCDPDITVREEGAPQ